MSKGMTVNQLHKILSKIVDQNRGRMRVAINKRTFNHPLEGDGCVILNVHNADMEWICRMDGDGSVETRADGSECGSTIFVLEGEGKSWPFIG